MKANSFLFVLCCLFSTITIQAQNKSCSQADRAKCAKAMNITMAECAKRCAATQASVTSNEARLVEAKPVLLTADQKTRVASVSKAKQTAERKSYKCSSSKKCCSKSKAKASKVAVIATDTKKKAVRA